VYKLQNLCSLCRLKITHSDVKAREAKPEATSRSFGMCESRRIVNRRSHLINCVDSERRAPAETNRSLKIKTGYNPQTDVGESMRSDIPYKGRGIADNRMYKCQCYDRPASAFRLHNFQPFGSPSIAQRALRQIVFGLHALDKAHMGNNHEDTLRRTHLHARRPK
jgi:hypothetical protein